MLLNLLIGIAYTLVLAAAGMAVALTWAPEPSDDDSPLWHLLLALGWGFGLIPFLAFCIALFGQIALVPAITLGVAGCVAAGSGAWWWFRQNRVVPVQLTEGWRQARWVLLASAGVGLVYLLKYDRSVFFLESCIHRVVMQTLHLTGENIDILASNRDDQRLGNTSVISSFVVLYRGLGFRLLYAFCGFFIALGGFLLGRRLLGSRRWAWFVLFALPLNPYVAKIPLLDENLLTLAYCSLFLPLMLRRQVPWGHVGALYGLAVMMRHVGILCGPAVLWAVWVHQGDRWRALGRGFLAFNAVTITGHIHHKVALGSFLKFESYGQLSRTFEHRLVGEYSGLLQWPFADHVLRTPWNPLPTFLMWPTYLADHLGLVLFSAMLVGIVVLLRINRREGVFWIAWIALAYLALSLQENWDVPNKMGIIYILFHPFILWAAVGLREAARAPRTTGVALLTVALLCGIGARVVRAYDAPLDDRYYQAWEQERREDPAYVHAERQRITEIAPWPDYGRLGPLSRVFHGEKFIGLWRDLADARIDQVGTPYGWFPGDRIDPAGGSVVLEIDLSERLFDRESPFVRAAPAGVVAHVDLTRGQPPQVIPNIEVAWSPRPVSVLLSRGGADVTGLSLVFERWADPGERRQAEHLHEQYHRGLQMVLGWGADDLAAAQRVPVRGTTIIRVRVPAGPLSVIECVNNAGQNYLYWRARIEPGRAVALEGPARVFHN